MNMGLTYLSFACKKNSLMSFLKLGEIMIFFSLVGDLYLGSIVNGQVQ